MTKKGHYSPNRIERVKEDIIKRLNSDEIDFLIASLVDYKEGSVLGITLERIRKAVV